MDEPCPYQQELEEELALGVGRPSLPPALQAHLDGCPTCQATLEEGLLLNRLLQEPLGMPPADLTERILAAVAEKPAAVPFPIWERLAWAALGALLTLAYQSLNLSGLATLGDGLLGLLPTLAVPELGLPALSSSWMSLSLALALVLQGALVLRYRKEAL